MLTDITITPMYVTDQDVALNFYRDKLGFVLDIDTDLGNMRWLTVSLPARPERRVLLQLIGDPTGTGSPETTQLLRELTERGTGTWMILATDNIRAEHQRLVTAGVEITQEPVEQSYGTDMAIRDPFGNQIRITEYPTG